MKSLDTMLTNLDFTYSEKEPLEDFKKVSSIFGLIFAQMSWSVAFIQIRTVVRKVK